MADDFYRLDDAGQALAMDALAQAALPLWGLQGSQLALIKYRENAVFRVTTPEATHYALRIHRHGYHTDAELASELAWMAALSRDGVAVPVLLSSLADESFATVAVDAVPEPRQVDVFEWIDGHPLGSVEGGLAAAQSVTEIYRAIGQLAARLHNQASTWKEPANFQRHAWDVNGLVGQAPFWGPFWQLAALTEDERELLFAARDALRRDLYGYAADPANADRYGLIHADLVAENLMVTTDGVRLIDFDDAGYGFHLFELATVLHFEMEEEHFAEAFAALVAGYREHRPLPDAQLAFMPMFFLARSTTYLGWVHTRSETITAKELTPMLVAKCCTLAREYLGR